MIHGVRGLQRGMSLNINPGGQIPYDNVVNSMRLLMEHVAPHFE